ncbi:MAG: hypothetical protein AB1634_17335, partial [Thermodesulfobacteriota bacterium]
MASMAGWRPVSEDGMEERLAAVEAEVAELRRQVAALVARLGEGTADPGTAAPRRQAASPGDPDEGLWAWMGKEALLPRVAAVSFMLVVALILRTLTDSGLLHKGVGSGLGMAYVLVLIAAGWWLYRKGGRLAPVFPTCGALLLFSIVFETHGHFAAVSTFWAYTILFVAEAVLIAMALAYRAGFLLCLATLGPGLVGMALDFPRPLFPYLGMLLLLVNLPAYLPAGRALCPSLRWSTLGLSLLFWLFWTFKVSVPATCGEPPLPYLHLSWFVPLLLVFWSLYTALLAWTVTRAQEPLGFFEGLVPLITSLGAAFAGQVAVATWYGGGPGAGLAALA